MINLPSISLKVIGSGGKIFQPSQLAGLAAWYSADFGVLTQATNAASFTASSSQTLTAASNPSLQTSTGSWEISCWINPSSLTESAFGVYLGKSANSSGIAQDYILYRPESASTTLRLIISHVDGGSNRTFNASGLLVVDSWAFVTFGFDGTNAFLRLNNLFVSTGAISGATYQGNGPLTIGGSAAWNYYSSSRVAMVGFWKRTLTADERTFLYQNGTGRVYSDLTPALKTGLVSYWNLSESGGARNDSHGTNHLTANNNPSTGESPYATPAADGQTVRRWLDRSGNGRHLEQPTLLNQPTFKATGTTGIPCLRGDGIASSMSVGFPAINDLTTIWATKRVAGAAGSKQLWDLGGGARPYAFYTGSAISGGGGAVLATTGQMQHVVAIRHSTTAGRQVIAPNLTASGLGSNGSGSLSPLRVFSGDSQNFDNSDLSEFVQYTRLLSDSELAKIFAYLVRRWGNSLNP